MSFLKNRREMGADFPDLVIADVGAEYLGQYLELALSGELLVIEVGWIANDRIFNHSIDMLLDLGANSGLHPKITSQKKPCGFGYLIFSCPS